MSSDQSLGPSGAGAGGGGSVSGSSTPSKHAGSSLSASLTAHLNKPVAPSLSSAAQTSLDSSATPHSSPLGLRLPGHVSQNGKAPATFADSDQIANSELWKSNAARRAEKAWATQSEKTLQADPKFKKFTTAIEKCLATFESVSEWADFIAFLGRLLKTLQTSPQFNAIPRKLIVAKRLSQCLNPALPSGVHQRALEVYEHIFTVIGTEGLRRDLSVWSPGLLPFFQFASTNVKPIVLNLIEVHYLPLRQDLRPTAKPVQLALLPGLEEETGEHFERVLRLLDKVKESIGHAYFMQNIWLILISMPVVRLPALHYLSRRMPDLNGRTKEGSSMDVSAIIGPDLGLTVRAFCAALEDSNLLVLRAMLDILVVRFRLDSVTFKSAVREEDRIRLLHAALGVVLRRDISLNRRLYAWLLGSSEDVKVQQTYFSDHALHWARLALLAELNVDVAEKTSDSDEQSSTLKIDRQKPYRILISLLDKWSIGSPMTSAVIIDTFKALQRQLTPDDADGASLAPLSSSSSSSSDISTTAKMLFEAIDPFAMYRRLFQAVCQELRDADDTESSTDVISLLRFVFASFRVHDEESRVVHLPVMFAAIVELVHAQPNSPRAPAALYLARDILSLIPKRVFADRSSSNAVTTTSFVEQGTYLYETTPADVDEAAKRYKGFQHPDTIANLLSLCATIPIRNPRVCVESLTIFCQLLGLLDATMESNQKQSRVTWNSGPWLEEMKTVLAQAKTFIELEACIETFVAGSQCRALAESLTFQRRDILALIFDKLLFFMQAHTGPYHVRSVELLWTVADLSSSTPVGTILCRRVTSSSQQERQGAFATFGVLWNFSDDVRRTDAVLLDPLLCILDGLRSSNWVEAQMSEAWVRDHANNFISMLDPLLLLICDQSCYRIPIKHTVDGHEIDFLAYARPLDHERVQYALSILLRICQVGGPGMARAIRSANIKNSSQKTLSAQGASKEKQEYSYFDFVFDILVQLIKSDPSEQSAYLSRHEAIHATAVDILKVLINRVQGSSEQLAELETILLQRLLIDVSKATLQVQSKYLQTLHSIVSARHPSSAGRPPSLPPVLLLSAIKAGLSIPTNRPALQQWTDFILGIAPTFRHALSTLLLPLNQGVCALIRAGITELEEAYNAVDGVATCNTTDGDLVLLMGISEKVLLQSLDTQGQFGSLDNESQIAAQKAEPFSFMGALSNVFAADPSSSDGMGVAHTNAVWKSLHQTVMTLHLAWLSTTMTPALEDARQDTLETVRQTIQQRCRRYLERLYRNHSGEVVEALIACWNISAQQDSQSGCEAAFSILAFLAPSAQIVVTFLCDVISTRTSETSGGSEKGNSIPSTATNGAATSSKHMTSPGVPDTVLLAFMEAYLQRLDASTMVQVWPVMAIFVKDILNNSTLRKAQIFPTLRCLTVASERILDEKQHGADDRKLKRELLDSYVRICDLSILIAGRSFEQTTWIGRRTIAVDVDADDVSRDEKLSASLPDLGATSPSAVGASGNTVEAVQQYLAKRVLPALKAFSLESDKVAGLSSNIVYYVVAPALKSKRKTAEVNANIVNLLLAVTTMPSSSKSWRTAVSEFFLDNRFFDMNVEAGLQWAPIIFALMTNDKERFVETIGRISTPSTNIFTNREAETRLRVMNLRRMSYVLFAGPKDHWLTQLPLIQEKLVDLLRNSSADPAISEVYLCLRVLLVRFESRHLSGFWPVVITEMMRLFEATMEELPADDSDALSLLDSACHLLDLLVTLQTDEFQIHQWLFITDTVDVIYPPDDWEPESILDKLAATIAERRSVVRSSKSSDPRKTPARESRRPMAPPPPSSHVRQTANAPNASSANGQSLDETAALRRVTFSVEQTKRRPLLYDRRGDAACTIEDLLPFFANISLHAFESTYASGAQVDWHAIEAQLLQAFFAAQEQDQDDD